MGCCTCRYTEAILLLRRILQEVRSRRRPMHLERGYRQINHIGSFRIILELFTARQAWAKSRVTIQWKASLVCSVIDFDSNIIFHRPHIHHIPTSPDPSLSLRTRSCRKALPSISRCRPWAESSRCEILGDSPTLRGPRNFSEIQCRWVPWGEGLVILLIIWVNYNDLTATSLELWLIREMISKWP